MGLLSTFVHNDQIATSAQVGQYNCSDKVNVNSRLFGLSCMISDQTMYIACGENSIEKIIGLDPNGLPIQQVAPPIAKAFAMAAEHRRIWTVDQIGDQLLRLASWDLYNTTDITSCVFPMPRPLTFLGDQLDQLPLTTIGDDSFYLIGRVQYRNDLELISLGRDFAAGSECEGTQVPVQFQNFTDVPFPLQGMSWNSLNQTILLPIVMDWTTTLLASIDPITAIASPTPGFNMTLPYAVYTGNYDSRNHTYTVMTTRAWPVWSYKTFQLYNQTWTAEHELDVPDSQFFVQAACVY